MSKTTNENNKKLVADCNDLLRNKQTKLCEVQTKHKVNIFIIQMKKNDKEIERSTVNNDE